MESVPLEYLQDDGVDLDRDLGPDHADAVRQLQTAPWREEMMAAGMMVVYANAAFSKEVIKVIRDLGAGAGSMVCWDCNGTGRYEISRTTVVECPACKGSGKMLVSIP